MAKVRFEAVSQIPRNYTECILPIHPPTYLISAPPSATFIIYLHHLYPAFIYNADANHLPSFFFPLFYSHNSYVR